jgi:VanZ family protein
MKNVVLTLLFLWCALAAALALRPFTFDWSCLVCRNGATTSEVAGQLAFPKEGIARTAVPASFIEGLRAAEGFEIEARFTPYNASQSGPARILSYSAGPRRWNLMLGQRGPDLILRIRTNKAAAPGGMVQMVVPDVLVESRMIHVRATHDAGGTAIAVDGVEKLRVDGPRMDLAAWNSDFPLLIGNEATGNRAWLGSVARIAIRAGPGGPLLADFDFTGAPPPAAPALGASNIYLPSAFLGFGLRDETFGTQSLLLHVAMLLPVGFLFPMLLSAERSGGSRLALTMLVVFLFALAVEIAQHFTTNRTTSVLDLVAGLVGGLFGYFAYIVTISRIRR